MKAEEKPFLQFLEWADKNFIIPVYQRNYDWKKEQCKQLFDDIVQIEKDGFRTHFLWTIVVYSDDGYGKELYVIDGQQRLTTLSLLLLAIYKLLSTGEISSETVNSEQIYNEYLVNKYSTDQTKKIRLKPVKNDKEAFNSIFEWDKKEDSNVVVNYDYFYNRIRAGEITINSLYEAIKKIMIVEIRLKSWEDDPQLIFESLNSTWLDLSEADKVRNFILMKEDNTTQERFYRDYWNKIEVNTHFKVSDFLRDYLTMKERRIPNIGKVYLVFKEYILRNKLNIEDLLIDLLKFSIYYKIILTSTDEDKNISLVLKRINKLETIVAYPFMLELYSLLGEWVITRSELLEILLTIESFVFRRFICDVPTNALNKIFMQLWKEIEALPDYKTHYVDVFNYILLQKTGSYRLPNDQEFESSLLKKDIYNTQSRNKLHLLEKLESFEHRESDIERLIEDWILTIEHIMPQTLTHEWEKSLWNNSQEVQSKYLHTLWNITLTWYNSKYSNKSFIEKKTMEKWFSESRLYLNGYLKTINDWNEEEILKRYKVLKDKAMTAWKYPTTSYVIQKDESRLYTLSDEENFTWKTIMEFSFEGIDYDAPRSSWILFYEKMLQILYDKDPILMKTFFTDEHLWLRFFSEEQNKTAKIWEWLYYKYWLSAEAILYTLRIVLNKFEISLDDVTIYIK